MSQPIERWRSQAACRSHTVATSGLIWTVSNALTPGAPLEVQIQETFAFLDNSLRQAGSSKQQLLSVQVVLADMRDRDAFDELWCAWIGPDPQHWPQRAVYGAQLAPGLSVELIATATRGQTAGAA